MEPEETPLLELNFVRCAAAVAALRVSGSDIVVGLPTLALITLPLAFTLIFTVTVPSTLFS